MRAPRWSVAAAAMVAVVLVFGSCSSDSAEEPRRPLNTTPAPGAVVVSDETIGFAVSIPNSWVKMPTEIGRFDAAADDLRTKTAPEAASVVSLGLTQLKAAVRDGAVMAAIDPQTGDTANLITLEGSGQSPDEIAVGAANQLIPTGATDFAREPVTIDGVPAVRQHFRTLVSGETGPVTLTKSQIYVVRRGEAFILTLGGEGPGLDAVGTSLKLA